MPKNPPFFSPWHGGTSSWPALKEYEGSHLDRIALPLGGIGTGTVSLGGRGQLIDWEVGNRPAKGFVPGNSFFALYVKAAGTAPVTRALEGVLLPDFDGARGSVQPNAGLPRFRACKFLTAYPLAQVLLSDDSVPVDVRMEAFNPFIPGDSERSGIPMVALRFVLRNKTAKKLEAAVCGSLKNFIGTDGTRGKAKRNKNRFVTSKDGGFRGIALDPGDIPPMSEFFGTMALATDAANISYRTTWDSIGWAADALDFWDDFSENGELEERTAKGIDSPMASLAVKVPLAPKKEVSIGFLLTWHFPNRLNWFPSEEATAGTDTCCGEDTSCCDKPADWVGNFYCQSYRDAWDVVEKIYPQLPALEEDTVAFVEDFCNSSLPEVVKEAALFNLSTLRSQTCFRIAGGHLFGWEGCDDKLGCCHGSCTHVWNYENALPFLFEDLSRSMREVEFAHATDDQGMMSFRVNLPLGNAQKFRHAAADGQMGCLMRLYRDWKLSGDDGFLRKLWPHAKRALEFCWIPGGWDGDHDGVMEGCQHNTMDVEYYGPNPQMQFWYLGALRACEEMAAFLGETDFSEHCAGLFRQGSAWADENLFNGEYFEHHIQTPENPGAISPFLTGGMGSTKDFQLGAGCLVDQLVGQSMAHVCRLGYLMHPAHAKKTLKSILKYNGRKDFFGHFNHMRTYALNDESALLMAGYPEGRRPKYPFPYFTEVMTGFEYTAAVHMLQEGLRKEGLKCIADIRNRYDGQRRNPFDEAECGHHYARTLASWGAVLALTGFSYSAGDGDLRFTADEGRHFWSHGRGWGICSVKVRKHCFEMELLVRRGSLRLRSLGIQGGPSVDFEGWKDVTVGDSLRIRIPVGKISSP